MAGPHPAVAGARRAVRTALADLDGTDALVLVACSGGADSVALGAATAFVAPRLGLRAGAAIIDHGLQQGSAEVAERAASTCRGLGLDPVVVRHVRVSRTSAGVEADARRARYAALDDVAQETVAQAVLVGHTLDDQAESVLLGLARGSGARSLAGMAPRRGVLRRPFLGLRRRDTEAVCEVLGLSSWSDPTNGAPGMTTAGLPLRSQVRHSALPALRDVLGPGVELALARTAVLLRDDADLLDALAADLADNARRGHDGAADVVVLDIGELARAHAALRRRALRAAAIEVGCPPGALFAVHVDALDALVTAWRGQGPIHLPGNRRAERTCGRLLLRPPHTLPTTQE